MAFKFYREKDGKLTAAYVADLLDMVFSFHDTPHMPNIGEFLHYTWRQKVDLSQWMEIVIFLRARDRQLSSYRRRSCKFTTAVSVNVLFHLFSAYTITAQRVF